jgi:hypothetical protein
VAILGHATSAITAKHYSPGDQARWQRLEKMVVKTWATQPHLRLLRVERRTPGMR